MNNFIFNIASWDYPEELQGDTDTIFEFRLIYLAYKEFIPNLVYNILTYAEKYEFNVKEDILVIHYDIFELKINILMQDILHVLKLAGAKFKLQFNPMAKLCPN